MVACCQLNTFTHSRVSVLDEFYYLHLKFLLYESQEQTTNYFMVCHLQPQYSGIHPRLWTYAIHYNFQLKTKN